MKIYTSSTRAGKNLLRAKICQLTESAKEELKSIVLPRRTTPEGLLTGDMATLPSSDESATTSVFILLLLTYWVSPHSLSWFTRTWVGMFPLTVPTTSLDVCGLSRSRAADKRAPHTWLSLPLTGSTVSVVLSGRHCFVSWPNLQHTEHRDGTHKYSTWKVVIRHTFINFLFNSRFAIIFTHILVKSSLCFLVVALLDLIGFLTRLAVYPTPLWLP